jgi:hypothetical protein
MSWGPSHQPVKQPNRRGRMWFAVCIVWLILLVTDGGLRGLLVTLAFYAVVARILVFAYRWLPARTRLRVRILWIRTRHRLPSQPSPTGHEVGAGAGVGWTQDLWRRGCTSASQLTGLIGGPPRSAPS